MNEADARQCRDDAFCSAGTVSKLLVAPAVIMGIAGLIALVGAAPMDALAMGIGAATTLGVAAALRRAPASLGRLGARSTVWAAWVLATLLGAIPLLLAGGWSAGAANVFANPLSAWFESVSGLTSCGLTMTDRAHELGAALQWYRSGLEWLGGLSIVVLVASVSDPDGGERMLRLQGWARPENDQTLRLKPIALLYLGVTAAAVALMAAAGMPWWEAVNHGMAGASTGGFVMTADGFAAYPPLVKAAAIPVMVAGGLSLVLLVRFGSGRPRPRGEVIAASVFLGILVAGALVALGPARPQGWTRLDAVFQWTSAVTTTGFSARGDLTVGALPVMTLLLIAAMLAGGMSRSTAGGIKTDRLIALHRTARHRVFAIAWIGCALLGTVALMALTGENAWSSAFETVSALGTAGLSAGLTADDANPIAKLVLIALMLVGRLEMVRLVARAVRARDRTEDDGPEPSSERA